MPQHEGAHNKALDMSGSSWMSVPEDVYCKEGPTQPMLATSPALPMMAAKHAVNP